MTGSSTRWGARLLPIHMIATLALVATLGACSTAGSLPAGLAQRMDAAGAQIDHAETLSLINQYRAAHGKAPLVSDAALIAQAQSASQTYANSGSQPARPDGVTHMLLSAGYASFAETFSGWRGSPEDAEKLLSADVTRAGLGASYAANSQFGVYWVLLLDD